MIFSLRNVKLNVRFDNHIRNVATNTKT